MGLLAGPYGIAVKLGGYLLVMAALFGYGYYKGGQNVQTKWNAALTEQATRTASQIVAEAANAAKAETRAATVRTITKTKIKVVKEEVVRYVQSPEHKCEVGDQFVHVFDATSGVYNEGLNRVPSTDADPREPDHAPGGAPTSAEILSAYAVAIEQAAGYRDAYHALVEYDKGRYAVQQSFHAQDK